MRALYNYYAEMVAAGDRHSKSLQECAVERFKCAPSFAGRVLHAATSNELALMHRVPKRNGKGYLIPKQVPSAYKRAVYDAVTQTAKSTATLREDPDVAFLVKYGKNKTLEINYAEARSIQSALNRLVHD